MATFVHGKKSYFKINSTVLAGGASATTRSATDVSFPQVIDTAETSAMGDSAKSYVVGLTDATIQVSGSWDAAVDAVLAALVGNATNPTFEYDPNGGPSTDGGAAGNVKYTGSCIVTNYEVSGGIGDTVKYSLTLQVTGAVTRGTTT